MATSEQGPTLSGDDRTGPGELVNHIRAFSLDVMRGYDRPPGAGQEDYLYAARRRTRQRLEAWCQTHKVDDEGRAYLMEHADRGFAEAAAEYRRLESTGDFHNHLHRSRGKPMELPPSSFEMRRRAAAVDEGATEE